MYVIVYVHCTFCLCASMYCAFRLLHHACHSIVSLVTLVIVNAGKCDKQALILKFLPVTNWSSVNSGTRNWSRKQARSLRRHLTWMTSKPTPIPTQYGIVSCWGNGGDNRCRIKSCLTFWREFPSPRSLWRASSALDQLHASLMVWLV